MRVADTVIDAFAVDSVMCRAKAATAAGLPTAALHEDIAATCAYDASVRVAHAGRVAIEAMTQGDERTRALDAFMATIARADVDTIAARRRIGDAVIEKKNYPFTW